MLQEPAARAVVEVIVGADPSAGVLSLGHLHRVLTPLFRGQHLHRVLTLSWQEEHAS